ncbi:MAG: hypothetical protein HYZ83_04095, partial [Candidatus Omnitrophica bacterium]|nr:hypothetical protein [Candidatus Omnitrophota bacterium]
GGFRTRKIAATTYKIINGAEVRFQETDYMGLRKRNEKINMVTTYRPDGKTVSSVGEYSFRIDGSIREIVEYWENGKLKSRTEYQGPATKELVDRIINYRIDETTDIISDYEYEGSAIRRLVARDRFGRLLSVTQFQGRAGEERETSITTYFADGMVNELTTFEYDADGVRLRSIAESAAGDINETIYEGPRRQERIKQVKIFRREVNGSQTLMFGNGYVYQTSGGYANQALLRIDTTMYAQKLANGDNPIIQKQYFKGLKDEELMDFVEHYKIDDKGMLKLATIDIKLYERSCTTGGTWGPANYQLIATNVCVDRAADTAPRTRLSAELSFEYRREANPGSQRSQNQIFPVTLVYYEVANGATRPRVVYNYETVDPAKVTGDFEQNDLAFENVEYFPSPTNPDPDPLVDSNGDGNPANDITPRILNSSENIYVQDALSQVISYYGDTLSVKAVSQYSGMAGKERLVSTTTYKEITGASSVGYDLVKKKLADINHDGTVNDYDLYLWNQAFNNLSSLGFDAKELERAVQTLQTISTSGLNSLAAGAAMQIDFNGDGKIDQGEIDFYSKIVRNYVDVNFDGKVDAIDLGMVQNALLLMGAMGIGTPSLNYTPPGQIAAIATDTDGDGFPDAVENA